MKRIFSAIIALLLLLALFSACSINLPEDQLPQRGHANVEPEIVFFGHYDQDIAAAPIPWYVLDNTGGELLLLSQRILYAMPYSPSGNEWSTSGIRTWLNDTFYNAVFSDTEKSAMVGGDKVTLMTSAQANNTAYFGSDPVRSATATTHAVSAGCTGNIYWLADADGATNVVCVNGVSGAVEPTGYAASDPAIGVRPVIRVSTSAIAACVYTSAPLYGDGELYHVNNTSGPFKLALVDNTLPSLSVSSWSADDLGLTISCSLSSSLNSNQQIFCYLNNIDITDDDYCGWSSLNDGKLYFDGFPAGNLYDVRLAVTDSSDMTRTVGPVSAISNISALKIEGIKDGDRFFVGSQITFTAVGAGLLGTAPVDGDKRLVPASWTAGTLSGSFSASPYTANITAAVTGETMLTVSYQKEVFSVASGTWVPVSAPPVTLSVKFYIDPALSLSASPSDGRIFTGGRITITPSIDGGTWDFDTTMLSREGNRFTALKAGATRITYTVGGQSASFDVVIRLSALPDTGQNTMWLWLTGGASMTALITALLIGLHRRQRAEFIL